MPKQLEESTDSAKPNLTCRIPLRTKGLSRLKNEALTRRPKSSGSPTKDVSPKGRGQLHHQSLLPAAAARKRAPVEKVVTHDGDVLFSDAVEALPPSSQETPDSNQMQRNNDVPQESESKRVEGPLPNSKSESISKLKHELDEQTVRFEKLKDDLNIKQRAVMELYASMRTGRERLAALGLGQAFALPPTDELCVMNLARLPPDRLLELCTDSDTTNTQTKQSGLVLGGSFTIDTMKLYNIPMQLLASCEQALSRRKELNDWLDSFLTSDIEEIDAKKILLKINEFNSDSEILRRTLENVKENFFRDIYEITDTLRNTVNDANTFRVRTEELARELSEMKTQNATLKKQLQNVDYQKTQYSRTKIEELEKILKEERTKTNCTREKLVRAEAHAKTEADRITSLNIIIEQLKVQKNSLESKFQQLNDQSQTMKFEHDSELNKLSSIIKENKKRLEEMTVEQKTIQSEKESLENSLRELEQHYKESIQSLKNHIASTENELEKTEIKCNRLVEENAKLNATKKQVDDQLLQAELRNENLVINLNKKNDDIECKEGLLKEIQVLKKDLEINNKEIEAYKNMLQQKADVIAELEQKNQELHLKENDMKRELNKKNKNIADLEISNSLMKQQLEESSKKQDIYENQMTAFHNKLKELFQSNREFKDLDELYQKIKEQNSKLQVIVSENEELTRAVRNKISELERHANDVAALNNLIKQKDHIIKIFSDKREEEASLIKVLQNNLEIKSRIEHEYNRQLCEKNKEIANLSQDMKLRKERVQELENIVLTLEDQARELETQKRKDREKVTSLERKIAECEVYRAEVKHRIEPQFDLDNLIKILEDELECPFESDVMINDEKKTSKKYDNQSRRDKLEHFECHENYSSPVAPKSNEIYPAKIVMGNFIKKTYINPNHSEIVKADRLDRKKAIMSIETEDREPNANEFKGPKLGDDKNKGIYPGTQNDLKLKPHAFAVHAVHGPKEGRKCKVFKSVNI